MKKSITVIVIIVMLFNLISIKSYAEETEAPIEAPIEDPTGAPTEDPTEPLTEETSNVQDALSKELGLDNEFIKEPESYFDRLNIKKLKVTDMNGNVSDVINTLGQTFSGTTVFGILGNLLGLIPQIVNQTLELSLETIGAEKGIKNFTIYDTVMGNYQLFNITYNDIPTEKPTVKTPGYQVLKYYVIQYYVLIRNLSIALSLFVLLYIGIRMAISTLATDKSKYKKMLISWIESLLILIFMHFIIVIISEFLEIALSYVRELSMKIKITDKITINQIESIIFTNAAKLFNKTWGWNRFVMVATMWVITYYQVKFFAMYMKRLIEIGFLVLISPLVTVTYSIDKAGDGKAQAFQAWFSELLMKALIQLLHAILYCIFIASAGYIATKHPLLAAIFFSFLSRTEKIVKKIFSVKSNELESAKVPFIK